MQFFTSIASFRRRSGSGKFSQLACCSARCRATWSSMICQDSYRESKLKKSLEVVSWIQGSLSIGDDYTEMRTQNIPKCVGVIQRLWPARDVKIALTHQIGILLFVKVTIARKPSCRCSCLSGTWIERRPVGWETIFSQFHFCHPCHFGAKVQNCHKPFVDGSTTRHAAKVLIAPAYYTIGNRAGHQNSGPAKLFENF